MSRSRGRRGDWPELVGGLFPDERRVTLVCRCVRCRALLGEFSKHFDDEEITWAANTFPVAFRLAGPESDPWHKISLQCVACTRRDIQVSRADLDVALDVLLRRAHLAGDTPKRGQITR